MEACIASIIVFYSFGSDLYALIIMLLDIVPLDYDIVSTITIPLNRMLKLVLKLMVKSVILDIFFIIDARME